MTALVAVSHHGNGQSSTRSGAAWWIAGLNPPMTCGGERFSWCEPGRRKGWRTSSRPST